MLSGNFRSNVPAMENAENTPVLAHLTECVGASYVLTGADAEPELYAAQLDAMVMAAGGYISPEAMAVASSSGPSW